MKKDFTKLRRAFNPQCIAVVGDKDELHWLRAQSTFRGKLYSIQINPSTVKNIEALGIKNYASLLDIPDPVDLAIVAVPRAVAPRILEDCISKEVAAAHFFTAGFSESDTEEGSRLERLLAERAKEAGFHLIGPNCMGIFNPGYGVRQSEEQYAGSAGNVGFISQSGTHAIRFSCEAYVHAVDIGKSVSFGNGTVLDSTDYLEYFGKEADIKAIGMYIEGVKDGKKFLSMLKQVAGHKPVVIWKGGRSEEGRRAIASHTGSLAVPQAIWDAAIKQAGAISVKNMEELIDTLAAFLSLPPVRGNRVGVAGVSGGQSVAISDAFAEAGLNVPLLTQESYREFAVFFKLIGGSYRNPIDAGMFNRTHMKRILEILEKDSNIDNLIFLQSVRGNGPSGEDLESLSLLSEIRKQSTKPLMVILPSASMQWGIQQTRQISQNLRDQGLPTFFTLERGARALKNTLDYYSLSARR